MPRRAASASRRQSAASRPRSRVGDAALDAAVHGALVLRAVERGRARAGEQEDAVAGRREGGAQRVLGTLEQAHIPTTGVGAIERAGVSL